MESYINRKDFLKLSLGIMGGILFPRISFSEIKKNIYFTVDDGPKEGLDIMLKKIGKEDKITFFMLGGFLKNPKKFKQACKILELGHEIGNHSYSHPYFSKINLDRAKEEIEKTDCLIEKIYCETGIDRKLKLFRFPFGDPGYYNILGATIAKAIGCDNLISLRQPYKDTRDYDFGEKGLGNKEKRIQIALFLKELGYLTYFWSLDSKDYLYYTNKIPLENLLDGIEKTQDSEVVLAHDLKITAKYIIPFYKFLGYNFKVLGE